MSGIGSTLSIAKTAIAAQQNGLTVTGNNIANVNNPNYSLQTAEHLNRTPSLYGGFLFGTGVDTSQIQQSVNKFLEARLTNEQSTRAAFEEAESYMKVLEGYFDENSKASITSIMGEFWNSWHDLSNKPMGSAQRVSVYEKGRNFAGRLNKANNDLSTMKTDLNREINAVLVQVNSFSKQIAALNVQITGLEANRSANDLRDQRNALLNGLGKLINVDTFEQPNGSIIVNASNGSTLVNGADHYTLTSKKDKILWQGSYGSGLDITNKIAGGKLGGWLEIRDEILPKFISQIDILARETVWAMNYQHSQGTGLEYNKGSVIGDYEADQSGLLSSYSFGDKIDYSKAFTMWLKDQTSATAKYTKTQVDMGISAAKISNWQNSAPGQLSSRYKLTVVDGATLGNKEVAQTDGINLAKVQSSTIDLATALDAAIADQKLTINHGPSGTEIIKIKDLGGGAQRSAASIAKALSAIKGVDAHASKVSATFDLAGITTAKNGDEVQFSLYVEGVVHKQRFTVDSGAGTLSEQFENALRDAAKSINKVKSDQDLSTKGLAITSSSGRTLGVQDFEILDNAGVKLDNFSNFNAGDTVTFTVDTSGAPLPAGTTSTNISIVLPSGININDPAAVSKAFSDGLAAKLAGKPVSVVYDPSNNSIMLRTTDGSNITLKNAGNDSGNNASIRLAEQAGTTPDAGNGNTTLDFTAAANDSQTYNRTVLNANTIKFAGQGATVTIGQASAGGIKAGVIVGTLTILMEPGMTIHSSVAGAGGVFDGNWAKSGSSIMTLGGGGGFGNFIGGQTIEFEVDGIPITVPILAGSATELDFATDLKNGLNASFLAAPTTDYEVIMTGTSVSIVKKKTLVGPIKITKFVEAGGANISLGVKTGTGTGTNDPENDKLESGNTHRNFSTASLYADKGIIKWEKYDANGLYTGVSGLINVEEKGRLSIVESGVKTLSFDVAAGSLVAGNTMIINTDKTGIPDPLDFKVSGAGNAKNEIYKFSVAKGGKVGELAADEADTITIEWKTATSSGSFELKGDDPPKTPLIPIEVEVDGMTLKFHNGTIFDNDVFTITTNESGVPVSTNDKGNPTGELLSDWHWTIDSFAGQFNKQVGGMNASTTFDNRLKFETSDTYHALTNLKYSGTNGFNQENVKIEVKDWGAMDFAADDLQFIRSSSGSWGVANDPTGIAKLIPEGGDDDGFGIDFTGDGLADVEVRFSKKISGQGSVQLDFEKRNKDDLTFAFSDDSVAASSGLLAAAGINTFFKGHDAMTMGMNTTLKDTKYVAAGRINSKTGVISKGNNANALAMANVQHKDITMKQWTYDRETGGRSSLTKTSIGGYYTTMIGSMGIISRQIQSSKKFADIMVNNLTEQRNSVSAVSLDEEMIKLMKYQHAFSAASKLLKVSDEMLNTLISMR